MPPWMSGSEALVIWMSSTAMKAPRIAPKTAIQLRKLTVSEPARAITVAQ